MEPRLEVIEYLFKYYGHQEKESVILVPSYELKCPKCGGEFNNFIDGSSYAEDPNNFDDPICSIIDPIELIKYIHSLDESLKEELIYNTYHIGDIMLQCKTKDCFTEAFFEETELRVIKGMKEIHAYLTKVYGKTTSVTTTTTTHAGLAGFFQH